MYTILSYLKTRYVNEKIRLRVIFKKGVLYVNTEHGNYRQADVRDLAEEIRIYTLT